MSQKNQELNEDEDLDYDFEEEYEDYDFEDFEDFEENELEERQALIEEINEFANDNVEENKTYEEYVKEKNEEELFTFLGPQIITKTPEEIDEIKKNIKKYILENQREIVKENTDLFKKAGFIFEEFGENTIRLIGVPSMCMDLDTKELFIQILDEIDTVAITATQEKEEKFISTIACKAAVKANMKLTKEEVDKLMEQLLILPNPFTCPHGRPTVIKMSKSDIERKFSRR